MGSRYLHIHVYAKKAKTQTQPKELNGQRRFAQDWNLSIFVFKSNLVLGYNKQLNCTCCVKLLRAEGYNSITQHNRLLFDFSKGTSESKGIY